MSGALSKGKKKVRLLVKTSLMDIVLTLNVTMNEL